MQTSLKSCYFCVEESQCFTCGLFYHPLETEYCVTEGCNQTTLIHKEYVLPKDCENRDCLFHQLAVAAKKYSFVTKK
jgi:hypothetical protein